MTIDDIRWGALDTVQSVIPAGAGATLERRREFVRAFDAPGAGEWLVNASLSINGLTATLLAALTQLRIEMTVRCGVGSNVVQRRFKTEVIAPFPANPPFIFTPESPGVTFDLYLEVPARVPAQHVSVDTLTQLVWIGLAAPENIVQYIGAQIAPSTAWQPRIGKPRPQKRHELEELGERQRALQRKANFINR